MFSAPTSTTLHRRLGALVWPEMSASSSRRNRSQKHPSSLLPLTAVWGVGGRTPSPSYRGHSRCYWYLPKVHRGPRSPGSSRALTPPHRMQQRFLATFVLKTHQICRCDTVSSSSRPITARPSCPDSASVPMSRDPISTQRPDTFCRKPVRRLLRCLQRPKPFAAPLGLNPDDGESGPGVGPLSLSHGLNQAGFLSPPNTPRPCPPREATLVPVC